VIVAEPALTPCSTLLASTVAVEALVLLQLADEVTLTVLPSE
jgi:hypothetical protein